VSIFRPYFVDTGAIAVPTAGSATPILYIAPTATNDLDIARIRISCESASGGSAAPPTNGSLLFSLNKVTGTKAGGAAATPNPTGPSALAANTVFSSGSTAITGLTLSTEYWCLPIAFATGAFAEDAFENGGFERNIPASGTYAIFVLPQAASAGTSCTVRCTLDFSE
jgi:hypothetical protein